MATGSGCGIIIPSGHRSEVREAPTCPPGSRFLPNTEEVVDGEKTIGKYPLRPGPMPDPAAGDGSGSRGQLSGPGRQHHHGVCAGQYHRLQPLCRAGADHGGYASLTNRAALQATMGICSRNRCGQGNPACRQRNCRKHRRRAGGQSLFWHLPAEQRRKRRLQH